MPLRKKATAKTAGGNKASAIKGPAKRGKVPAKRAKANVPAKSVMEMMKADARKGLTGMSSEDLAMPFLQIIQSTSPQLNKRHDKFIEGAQEGMLFNSVTRELYDAAVIIPLSYSKEWVEWRDRDAGGGFVARHARTSPIVAATPRDEKGRQVLSNGNVLEETASYYVLIIDDDGDWSEAMLTMSRTQLGKARRFNTMLQQYKLKDATGNYFSPPMFAHTYLVSTVEESNDFGRWFGFVIEPHDPVEDPALYAIARAHHEDFSESRGVDKTSPAAAIPPPADEDLTADDEDAVEGEVEDDEAY